MEENPAKKVEWKYEFTEGKETIKFSECYKEYAHEFLKWMLVDIIHYGIFIPLDKYYKLLQYVTVLQ